MMKLLASALIATYCFAQQQLEWPGLPVDPAGTLTSVRIVRIVTTRNPPRVVMEEIPAPTMPAPSSFSMVTTAKASETDWCVDASAGRIVAGAHAVFRESSGLTRYVHYQLGAGFSVAAWTGCATGIRFSTSPGNQYGVLQAVSAYASNAFPLNVALFGSPSATQYAGGPLYPLRMWVLSEPSTAALSNFAALADVARRRGQEYLP